MKTKLVILLSLVLSLPTTLFAQGTAFTYQGRLHHAGGPANGLYEMNFALHDAVTNGTLVGTPLHLAPVPVTNGLFTVSLDFGAAAFIGANRWLEITVTVFGSDQPAVTLQPRQPLTPTPYTLHAYNAAGLMSFGNAPLDIKVNGERALRLEPTFVPNLGEGLGAPNLIGGSPNNSVVAGVVGATIGGGGATTWSDGGYVNQVAGNFGTVSGGLGNTASGEHATVSGGFLNLSSGIDASIGGGEGNRASRRYSTIGGGANNSISTLTTLVPDENHPGMFEQETGDGASVAGGYTNSVAGEASTIGGGAHNTVTGDWATLAGGFFNFIQADPFNSYGVTLSGGTSNRIQSSSYATVAGGSLNSMVYGFASTISGGVGNRMDSYCQASVIGGGQNNVMEEFGGAATIVGGENNRIGRGAGASSIGGGRGNQVASENSTVAGGNVNEIGERAPGAVIVGGDSNTIEAEAAHASIGGGFFNAVKSNAQYAIIPGGFDNLAVGQHSVAAGTRAQALHKGAFVWADYTSPEPNNPFGAFPFASTATNEFAVRATGGVRLVSAVNTTGAPVAGVTLTPGSGSWSSLSDRNAKENFTPANGREILAKVAALPMATWNYRAQDKSVRHLGPMAQDFHAAFGLGENDRTITTVDADGVALAAIQGLNQTLEEKDEEIQQLKKSVAELKELISRLAAQQNGGAR